MRQFIFKLPLIFVLYLSFVPYQALSAPLKICGDEAGWPPLTYADPDINNHVIGASTDTVKEILKRAGYVPKLELMPWKRCLHEVALGKHFIVLDATTSKKRAQTFYISNAFYSIHSALFYTRERFPQKPNIHSSADLKQYTYCGIRGYNYSMYNIPPNHIDTGAANEQARLGKDVISPFAISNH